MIGNFTIFMLLFINNKNKTLNYYMEKLKTYLLLARPKHWIKNLLIFLPLFFGLKLGNIEYLQNTIMAFVIFSMIASSIYIFNDLLDIEEDRKHHLKKSRPIASSKVSISCAYTIMTILLILGCALAYWLDVQILELVAFYIILNIFYTFKLKHFPIIDTFIIAIGFVIRIYIGAITSHVTPSMWMVLMTFLLAIFLALSKRKGDIVIFEKTGERTRKNIHEYTTEFLNLSMTMMASVVVFSYIIYITSASTAAMKYGDSLYLTVIFVLLGIMRYMQIDLITDINKSPTEILYSDRIIQFAIVGWITTLLFIMY